MCVNLPSTLLLLQMRRPHEPAAALGQLAAQARVPQALEKPQLRRPLVMVKGRQRLGGARRRKPRERAVQAMKREVKVQAQGQGRGCLQRRRCWQP